MIEAAKYGHTNLIAEDWRALARFTISDEKSTPKPRAGLRETSSSPYPLPISSTRWPGLTRKR